MRGARLAGAALTAALLPVLAAPAGAACQPVVTAASTVLQLEVPTVPVPLAPPRSASASVRQEGEGSDSASGTFNRTKLPITGGAFRVDHGTGEAQAQAAVVGGSGAGSALARVDGLRMTVPGTGITPDLVLEATTVQATASVDAAGAPEADAVLVGLTVNGVPVPVPEPGGDVVLPAGLGTLSLLETSSSAGTSQSASAQVLVLELTTGERAVLSAAEARLTGC